MTRKRKCPRGCGRDGSGGKGLLALCPPCRSAITRQAALARWRRTPGPHELRARALVDQARRLDRALVAGNEMIAGARDDYRRALSAIVRSEVA